MLQYEIPQSVEGKCWGVLSESSVHMTTLSKISVLHFESFEKYGS